MLRPSDAAEVNDTKLKGWQLTRLKWIEIRLRFLGEVRRADLIKQFGMNEITASRDLAEYKSRYPNNMIEDGKSYRRGSGFRPGLELTAREVLGALTAGESPYASEPTGAPITTMLPPPLREPDLDVLAVLTEAIHRKCIAVIEYCSLSSGYISRDIVPFVLANDGMRWHVRAYDRYRSRFCDFVLTRIRIARLIEEAPHEEESPEHDLQWMRLVELQLVPKPDLKHPEVVSLEYGMTDNMLRVRVRAALAGYVLRRMNVDCSPKGTLPGAEYHLWLQNHQSLVDVDNLEIAPGYSQRKARSAASP